MLTVVTTNNLKSWSYNTVQIYSESPHSPLCTSGRAEDQDVLMYGVVLGHGTFYLLAPSSSRISEFTGSSAFD